VQRMLLDSAMHNMYMPVMRCVHAHLVYLMNWFDNLQGVCTSWLAGLRPGSERMPVWAQAGVLRLPADPALPLLLVGPGTGVAPFRSFVEDRQADVDAGGQDGFADVYKCRAAAQR